MYERELSQNDYLKTTNNNYKKYQKVDKKNKNYLKIIIIIIIVIIIIIIIIIWKDLVVYHEFLSTKYYWSITN